MNTENDFDTKQDDDMEQNDKVGEAIRESVEADLPDRDPELRNEVMSASQLERETAQRSLLSRPLFWLVPTIAAILLVGFFLVRANNFEYSLQGIGFADREASKKSMSEEADMSREVDVAKKEVQEAWNQKKSGQEPLESWDKGRVGFLNGGEVPVPVNAGLGTTAVEFQPFNGDGAQASGPSKPAKDQGKSNASKNGENLEDGMTAMMAAAAEMQSDGSRKGGVSGDEEMGMAMMMMAESEAGPPGLDSAVEALTSDPSRQVAAVEAVNGNNFSIQKYTVQVPVNSTRTETYTVQVPYTENVNGKTVTKTRAETRTREVPVTEMKTETRTRRVPHIGRDIDGRGGEQYEPIHENPFIAPDGENALSTFSIDVDTASYSNMRRFLASGRLPPPSAVRIEELVNYFSYDYPQPKGDDPFSVNMEIAACPWNPGNRLLRVGLKGKEIDQQERPTSNLVFLLDVSGSMKSEDKLPLLKRGMKMLVDQLGENDTVSIVTYASGTGVKLKPTNGTNKAAIKRAIDELNAGGSTNGSAGIELAYQQAEAGFIEEGTNRVILATDGDLNVGITKDNDLVNLIKEKAASDIFLTVLGFGTGNLKDAKMEKLADNGNGMYAYIDSFREARKVLVQQMSGSLVTIAKDVKLQLEFNPGQVAAYRLIGYENRVLAARDFDDDKKDAGEIGAGHTVTALYEIVPTGANAAATDNGPKKKLKYQKAEEVKIETPKTELTKAAESSELLTLALRYKQPDSDTSKKIEFTVQDDGTTFSEASDDLRFAASVASFGMLLRNSSHRGSATFSMVEDAAANSMGSDKSGYRAEFLDLVRKAGKLTR